MFHSRVLVRTTQPLPRDTESIQQELKYYLVLKGYERGREKKCRYIYYYTWGLYIFDLIAHCFASYANCLASYAHVEALAMYIFDLIHFPFCPSRFDFYYNAALFSGYTCSCFGSIYYNAAFFSGYTFSCFVSDILTLSFA